MAEKEVKRYQKGDLPGGDLTAIPLDPQVHRRPHQRRR